MHIEGQRGGRAALGELFQGERMAEQLFSPAAQRCGDVERMKPGLTQQGIILDRIACLAVMLGRPGGEVCGQFLALGLNALVLGRQLEIHTAPFTLPGC